ncbi:MAG: hypothetical protein AB1679_14310 [Actinomycetota bacterium]|jgi:hypothetical protein
METVAAAAITAIVPLVGAMWRDMRRRTNGVGPLGTELKEVHQKLDTLKDWTVWHDLRHRAENTEN